MGEGLSLVFLISFLSITVQFFENSVAALYMSAVRFFLSGDLWCGGLAFSIPLLQTLCFQVLAMAVVDASAGFVRAQVTIPLQY